MNRGTSAVIRPVAETTIESPSPAASVRALARSEALRLLRHPALLGSSALCVCLWVYETVVAGSSDYPVLHDEDRYLQVELLLVAAGTFLATHLAVLRPARDGTDAWFQALVLERWQRVAAHLLAVLPAVILAAVLAGLRTLWLALLPGAVGTASAAELATGPVLVLFAGALAVLSGTVSRSVALGPITVGVLGVATVTGSLAVHSGVRWWGLIAIEDDTHASLPSELLARPAALHLLYIALVSVVLAAAALLRSGLRGGRRPVQAVLAVALVGTLGAGAAQLRSVPDSVTAARERAATAPSGDQRCVRREEVTYCAFPEFLDRSKEWSEVADGILRRVPESARDRHYTVRQHVTPFVTSGGFGQDDVPVEQWAADDRRAGTPGAVVVGTDWGNGDDAANDATSGLATAFAQRVVQGRTPSTGSPALDQPLVCGAQGIVTLWLAAQATPETAPAIRDRMDRNFGGLVTFGFGPLTTMDAELADTDTALRLLDRPADDVAAALARHWQVLTDPDTTSTRAADLLGIRGPVTDPATEKDSACANR
ncbi:ABC transporter permease [Streptomyces sp. NPDC003006]